MLKWYFQGENPPTPNPTGLFVINEVLHVDSISSTPPTPTPSIIHGPGLYCSHRADFLRWHLVPLAFKRPE